MTVDYFLDKKKQISNSLANFLEKILLQIDTISYTSKINENECKSELRKILINDISKNDIDNTLNTIYRILQELNFNPQAIQGRIAENIQNANKDIFDELEDKIAAPGAIHIKILFPFNVNFLHWLTGEIKIHKKINKYDIEISAHDPYGRGEILPNYFKLICDTLQKKIKEIDKNATFKFKNIISPYTSRQNPYDDDSCGVIVVEDLFKLITGGNLQQAEPHPYGAVNLRKEHRELVERLPVTDKDRVNFLEKLKSEMDNQNIILVNSQKSLNLNGKDINPLEIKKSQKINQYNQDNKAENMHQTKLEEAKVSKEEIQSFSQDNDKKKVLAPPFNSNTLSKKYSKVAYYTQPNTYKDNRNDEEGLIGSEINSNNETSIVEQKSIETFSQGSNELFQDKNNEVLPEVPVDPIFNFSDLLKNAGIADYATKAFTCEGKQYRFESEELITWENSQGRKILNSKQRANLAYLLRRKSFLNNQIKEDEFQKEYLPEKVKDFLKN